MKLKAKIRALRALAESTTHEGERRNALHAIQRLEAKGGFAADEPRVDAALQAMAQAVARAGVSIEEFGASMKDLARVTPKLPDLDNLFEASNKP